MISRVLVPESASLVAAVGSRPVKPEVVVDCNTTGRAISFLNLQHYPIVVVTYHLLTTVYADLG